MQTRAKKQVSTPERVVLDASSLRPFEIGARLDALLCYSTWKYERQQKIADTICSDLIACTIEAQPARKAELRQRYPRYRKSSSRGSLSTLFERREEVLGAGCAFLPLLKQPATGDLPILGGSHRQLSIAEIARYLWPDDEGGTEEHYESRLHDKLKLLRSLRPVAHVAAAYQYTARELCGGDEAKPFDYQDLEFHRGLVSRAAFFAECFRSTPALANIAGKIIDIEWRE